MSTVIGIDLGTTNSCVAVPEATEIPNKEKLLAEGRLWAVGGALVIAENPGVMTTPSAVWVDQTGAVEVGVLAKSKAKRSDVPPPALFFKRLMGTRMRVTAGYQEMTPEEASACVLRRMKAVAEGVLGAPVDRAVITVPAFFDNDGKNATTEAGRLAGLEVVNTLLEPVAAAMTYTRSQEPDREMTFMVYDLGGGTFDVAVVSWDPDIGFEMKKSDGHKNLGGYDLDYKIVRWLLPQLKGYDVANLNEEDPVDKPIHWRLTILAEGFKEELTEEPVVDVLIQNMDDRRGVEVRARFRLTREIFEQLIEPEVATTLDSCDRALLKSEVRPDELDEIIMVGGSSRIPLVGRRLKERYGRTPRLLDPDLCVAVGAALKAAMAPTKTAYLALDHIAEQSNDTVLDVAGQVIPGDLLASIEGVAVEIVADDTAYRREDVTNAEGRFLFMGVPLHEDDTRSFRVRVLVDGAALDTQRFAVTHAADAPPELTAEGDILSKEYSIKAETGLFEVVPAGTKLPFHATIEDLETATQRGQVKVVLYEGLRAIGSVEVTDLPPDLPVGSDLVLDLLFDREWKITATARVPAAGTHAVGKATIMIPKVDVPSWADIKTRLERANANWEQLQKVAPEAELMEAYAEGLEPRLAAVAELEGTKHDHARAYQALVEAETLVAGVKVSDDGTVLHPPRPEFESALDELAALVDRLERMNPEAAGHHRTAMRTMRTQGRAAYEASDALGWRATNEAVERAIARVRQELGIDKADGGGPSAGQMQWMLRTELDEIGQVAGRIHETSLRRFQSTYDELTAEIKQILDAAMAVDTADERAAASKLSQLYHTRVGPLRAKVEKWRRDALGTDAERVDVRVRLPESRMGGAPTGRRG